MIGNPTAPEAARTYETRDIETADPTLLVLRVFEIALLDVTKARAAACAGDRARGGRHIGRVLRSVDLLQTNLDIERGGEPARNMDRIYDYLRRRLTRANLDRDDAVLAEVADHLAQLASAWREVVRRPRVASEQPMLDSRSPRATR